MISTLSIAALLGAVQPPAAAAPEPTETRCDYLVDHDGRVEPMTVPELHVLRQTAADGPFAPGLPPGAAIRCDRSDIVPAANDWKVLAAGHVLAIVDVAQGSDSRIAVLEMVEGRLRFRFIAGRLTEAEAPRIQARLDAFQLHFRERGGQ